MDKNTLSSIVHISGLFTSLIGPTIIYFVTDNEFVKKNCIRSLNWQISFLIYLILSTILSIIVIGLITGVLAIILNIVFCIVAAIKVNGEKAWSYPLTISIL